ncbi:Hypothetical protein NTJ_12024 [Nesidiocoris tenuis]|uniref:Uncharacterized protein n=1 Tax=Nesidiocoris tenuis TaxID=355587 RepID=A0ABN7B467_9HEMI|nr:Hypothetical protein NTJ_12024 [Nesidiocoris tenuis]
MVLRKGGGFHWINSQWERNSLSCMSEKSEGACSGRGSDAGDVTALEGDPLAVKLGGDTRRGKFPDEGKP